MISKPKARTLKRINNAIAKTLEGCNGADCVINPYGVSGRRCECRQNLIELGQQLIKEAGTVR